MQQTRGGSSQLGVGLAANKFAAFRYYSVIFCDINVWFPVFPYLYRSRLVPTWSGGILWM
jgi:hypothetical protein